MVFSPLIPLAAATAAPAIGNVVQAVSDGLSNGLSFLDVLHRGEEQPAEDKPEKVTSELGNLLSLGGGQQGLNIQESAKAALEKFQQRLRQVLSENGIDLSQPLQLQGNSLGGVHADHPQRAQIEQIFADDPELANAFNALSATYSLLQTAEQHKETVAQLTGDSDSDAELLSRKRKELGEFGLLINGDETDVFFE